jgi:hypothetical protein
VIQNNAESLVFFFMFRFLSVSNWLFITLSSACTDHYDGLDVCFPQDLWPCLFWHILLKLWCHSLKHIELRLLCWG